MVQSLPIKKKVARNWAKNRLEKCRKRGARQEQAVQRCRHNLLIIHRSLVHSIILNLCAQVDFFSGHLTHTMTLHK